VYSVAALERRCRCLAWILLAVIALADVLAVIALADVLAMIALADVLAMIALADVLAMIALADVLAMIALANVLAMIALADVLPVIALLMIALLDESLFVLPSEAGCHSLLLVEYHAVKPARFLLFFYV